MEMWVFEVSIKLMCVSYLWRHLQYVTGEQSTTEEGTTLNIYTYKESTTEEWTTLNI